MIPTHQSEQTNRNKIVLNTLGVLNDYDFSEPHRHSYFEFFYFKEGGGFHQIDFINFPIQDNSIHIVSPGQVHQMKRSLDSQGIVFLFELPALQAPPLLENFLFEHICMDAEELNPCYKLPDNSRELQIMRYQNAQGHAKGMQEVDLIALRLEIQAFCIECIQLKKATPIPQDSRYLQFRKLLKNHYKSYKMVKDYAQLMHLSEKSLNNLVKEHTGQTTSSIIYKQVIIEAKRLLHTGMSIKETAYTLEFEDPSHFSKFFKSKTGMNPSDFLKGG